VEYLLTHPAEAEAMGRRGRAAVAARFHWAAEADKLLALYERLRLGRRAARCVSQGGQPRSRGFPRQR
jgi:hypothetical protein